MASARLPRFRKSLCRAVRAVRLVWPRFCRSSECSGEDGRRTGGQCRRVFGISVPGACRTRESGTCRDSENTDRRMRSGTVRQGMSGAASKVALQVVSHDSTVGDGTESRTGETWTEPGRLRKSKLFFAMHRSHARIRNGEEREDDGFGRRRRCVGNGTTVRVQPSCARICDGARKRA